jgi:hypothetical protein
MRCKKVFAVDLPDHKLSPIRIVGDLYVLICDELKLTTCENPKQDTGFNRGLAGFKSQLTTGLQARVPGAHPTDCEFLSQP